MSNPDKGNETSSDVAGQHGTNNVSAKGTEATGSDRVEGASDKVSAEEQMAAYEKDLKENDWGHQPC